MADTGYADAFSDGALEAEGRRREHPTAPAGAPFSPEALKAEAARRVQGGTISSALDTPGRLAAAAAADFERLNQRQEGIDYWTGVRDGGFRFAYSRMDTPEEKALWLSQNVGANDPDDPEGPFWGTDKFGTFALTPRAMDKLGLPHKGMPVVIDEHSGSWQDVADFGGDLPTMLGEVGAGLRASRYGFIPGVIASGLGAAAGKVMDEGIETFQGYQQQTPGEVGMDALQAAGYGILGEGAVRAARPIGRYALGPNTTQPPAPGLTLKQPIPQKMPPRVSTIDPARLAATDEVLEAGGRPRIGTATDKRLAGMFENITHLIFGDPLEAQNRKVILQGIGELEVDAAGGWPGGVDPLGVGGMVEGKVLGRTGALAQRVDDATKRANQYQEDAARQLSGQDPKFLGEVGQESIDLLAASREQFAVAASGRYGRFDEMIGGAAVVPTQHLKDTAHLIASRVPPTKSGKASVFQNKETAEFIAGVDDLPDYITAQQMQAIRTTLREAAYDPNILVGISKKHAGDLKHAADRAFSEVGEEQLRNAQGQFASAGRTQDELKDAIAYLSDTTKWYAEGIGKYDNTFILKLTREAGKGGIEPDDVVNYIIRPKKRAAILAVKKLLSPEQWEKIADTHFQRMLDDARDIEGFVDGAAISRAVKKMGFTLDEVYGPSRAGQIRRFAEEAASKNGKYPVDDLADSPMKDAIAAMRAADEELAAWGKLPFVKRFSADAFDPEKEARLLLAPNSSRDISQVRSFLGENSPEWDRIRETSMGLLLKKAFTTLDDPVVEVILGKGLRKAVDDVGENTLTAMFGRQQTADLQKFSRVAHFLTTKKKGSSGALIAAAIAVHPLRNLGKLAKFFLLRKWFAAGGLRHMTVGFDLPKTRWTADNITRMLTAIMAQERPALTDIRLPQMSEPPPIEGGPELNHPAPPPQ